MIQFFIRRPKLGLLLAVIIFLAGIFSLLSLRKEAFPTVNFAMAKIITTYPGATPEDVEFLVTKKIEDELREIDGLKEVRSVSQFGRSEITIKVDLDHVDVQKVMNEIKDAKEKVTDLPTEIEDLPVFEEIKTQNFPILELAVISDLPEINLKEIVDDIELAIENLNGVSSVEVVGEREREFKILLNTRKMKDLHISFTEVVNAIKKHNVDLPGGRLDSHPIEKSVRVIGKVQKASELLSVVIRTNLSGKVIFLKDVATVEDGFEDYKVITKTNGKRSQILVINKKELADIIDLSNSVKSELKKFSEKYKGQVEFLVSNDESLRTSQRLDLVISNTWIGLALVVVSLLLFLNWRLAIITSLSMPIIVMGTLVLMQFTGITFNLISMLAIIIALGMFVDNSIVVSENIHRFLEEGDSMKEAAIKGTVSIFWPVTATILTTIAAFAPMLVTKGIMGEFIFSIPVLVSGSLIICLLESFLLLPSRIVIFDSKEEEDVRSGIDQEKRHWFEKVQKRFEKVLDWLVLNKWKSVMGSVFILVGAFVWAGTMMDFVLFPPEGVDKLVLKYEAKPGTDIEYLHKEVSKIETVILSLPKDELRAIVTRTGVQQIGLDDPLARTGQNLGMIMIYLTSENQRDRIALDIVKELRSKIKNDDTFTKVTIEQLVNGPPIGKPVTLTVLGKDLSILEKLANDIKKYLKSLDGTFDIDTDYKDGIKQVSIKPRENASSDYGIETRDIADALRISYEGSIASTITKFSDEIDLRIQLREEDRGNLNALKHLEISDNKSNLIPLYKLAYVDVVKGPKERRHNNFLRSITITSDINLEKTTSIEVNQKLRTHFKNLEDEYPGYHLKFGGEDESTKESMASLLQAMIIAILCVYAILVTLFDSLTKPLLIIFSIPFGFIGTIIGFSLHDKPLGFLAMIGAIGLAGVVVNASIVMISFIDELRDGGMAFHEALVKGASMRLRPIVLTTLTTVSALFPTAYGIGGWDPMLVPMTLALAWGLLFGTILTLFIIPSYYAALESVKMNSLRILKQRLLKK